MKRCHFFLDNKIIDCFINIKKKMKLTASKSIGSYLMRLTFIGVNFLFKKKTFYLSHKACAAVKNAYGVIKVTHSYYELFFLK